MAASQPIWLATLAYRWISSGAGGIGKRGGGIVCAVEAERNTPKAVTRQKICRQRDTPLHLVPQLVQAIASVMGPATAVPPCRFILSGRSVGLLSQGNCLRSVSFCGKGHNGCLVHLSISTTTMPIVIERG